MRMGNLERKGACVALGLGLGSPGHGSVLRQGAPYHDGRRKGEKVGMWEQKQTDRTAQFCNSPVSQELSLLPVTNPLFE